MDQSIEPSSLESYREREPTSSGADLDALRVRYTRFIHLKDTTPKPRTATWGQLCERLEDSEESPFKQAAELWSSAIYKCGAERGNEGVVAISMLVLDFDKVPLDSALALLGGFELAAHITYNHTSEEPRWRVVLPLSREVAADEWPEFWRRVAFWLAPDADACKDLARFFFLPSSPARRDSSVRTPSRAAVRPRRASADPRGHCSSRSA